MHCEPFYYSYSKLPPSPKKTYITTFILYIFFFGYIYDIIALNKIVTDILEYAETDNATDTLCHSSLWWPLKMCNI